MSPPPDEPPAPGGGREPRGRRAGPAMSPSPRAAIAIAACAALALLAGPAAGVIAAVAVVAATVADAVAARRAPLLRLELAPVLARGVPAPLRLDGEPGVLVRQP